MAPVPSDHGVYETEYNSAPFYSVANEHIVITYTYFRLCTCSLRKHTCTLIVNGEVARLLVTVLLLHNPHAPKKFCPNIDKPPISNREFAKIVLIIRKLQIRKFVLCASPLIENSHIYMIMLIFCKQMPRNCDSRQSAKSRLFTQSFLYNMDMNIINRYAFADLRNS
jgi:hypothetical protein